MAEKSKIPDMGEISKMAGKLFTDVKNSVSEIVDDYKKHHADDSAPKDNATPEATVTPSNTTVVQGEASTDENSGQSISDESEDNNINN